MYLLDPNVCIYLMKDRFPALTERVLARRPEELFLSSVTVFELEYGAEKSRWGERTRLSLYVFLSAFQLLPFTAADAAAAGRIRGQLMMQGRPIGPYDVLIAGQALARGLTVVTHNTDEFTRVTGLRTEDWTLPEG